MYTFKKFYIDIILLDTDFKATMPLEVKTKFKFLSENYQKKHCIFDQIASKIMLKKIV